MTRDPLFHDDHAFGGLTDRVLCVALGADECTPEQREQAYDQFSTAASILLAAVPVPDSGQTIHDMSLGNPICHMVRHAVELALKVPKHIRTHGLGGLLDDVKTLGAQHGLSPSTDFEAIVNEFHAIDPKGEVFRYGGELANSVQCCVDVRAVEATLAVLTNEVETFLRPLAEKIEQSCDFCEKATKIK